VSLTGAIAFGSCTTIPGPDTQEGVPPITTDTVQENANIQYYLSDEPLRLGLEYFNRGNFASLQAAETPPVAPVDSAVSRSSESVGTALVPKSNEPIMSAALVSMQDRHNRLVALLHHLTVDPGSER
jgi:hypothetical protein